VIILYYCSIKIFNAGEPMISTLNDLGSEGWELVSIIPTNLPNNSQVFYIFKRKK
jgi:hypothetical protein